MLDCWFPHCAISHLTALQRLAKAVTPFSRSNGDWGRGKQLREGRMWSFLIISVKDSAQRVADEQRPTGSGDCFLLGLPDAPTLQSSVSCWMWPVASGYSYGFVGVGRCVSEGRVMLCAACFWHHASGTIGGEASSDDRKAQDRNRNESRQQGPCIGKKYGFYASYLMSEETFIITLCCMKTIVLKSHLQRNTERKDWMLGFEKPYVNKLISVEAFPLYRTSWKT
ncbi:hypothetical protein Cgig2_008110 [Carnegiea gigantea]|uniref:Uncharacterized protein n=1 Tax=Carnegiea gigantea TaxID=171969 RepID=A0A9Q1QTQ5_9CARY|nr:hypothetical protein Cgig2_008110 [Carnegiea gigantea]